MKPPTPTSLERGEKSSNKTRKVLKKTPSTQKTQQQTLSKLKDWETLYLQAQAQVISIKMYWHKMWKAVLYYSGQLRKTHGHLSKRVTPIRSGVLQRDKNCFQQAAFSSWAVGILIHTYLLSSIFSCETVIFSAFSADILPLGFLPPFYREREKRKKKYFCSA